VQVECALVPRIKDLVGVAVWEPLPMSQLRHEIPSNFAPNSPKTATEASAIQAAAWQPKMRPILRPSRPFVQGDRSVMAATSCAVSARRQMMTSSRSPVKRRPLMFHCAKRRVESPGGMSEGRVA
jgi:hypothetical protein